MNELVKSQLEAAGFEVDLKTMDWNALLDLYRGGVDKNPNYDGLNFSRGLLDPVNAIIKLVGKGILGAGRIQLGALRKSRGRGFDQQDL